MDEKAKAYVALGANLGDRLANLYEGVDLLGSRAGVYVAYKSPVYESPAAGVTDQPDFMNMVVEVETWLGPSELYARCREVEDKMGRARVREKGPRVIDLDILLYEDIVLTTEDLTIPHPSLTERAFFLVPLKELAGNIIIPGTGIRINDALARLGPYKLTRVNERGW